MAQIWKDFRDESRLKWGADIEENQTLDPEAIKLGAILRIADATELMAKNYERLQGDLELYKKWYARDQQQKDHLRRRISALQGVITRMKNISAMHK